MHDKDRVHDRDTVHVGSESAVILHVREQRADRDCRDCM